MLRVYSHYDYYKDTEPVSSDPPHIIREHISSMISLFKHALSCR
jgi:hypothetical protein